MTRERQRPCFRRTRGQAAPGAFTLLELLVVVAVIAILASLVLPALSRGKNKAVALSCLNNQKQLMLACLIYTDDFSDALPYNLGADEIRQQVARKAYWNWCSSVMNWELEPANTNTTLLTEGGLGPYTGREPRIYRCPLDFAVSEIQARAGWRHRVRSVSMNAMVGNAGLYTRTGENVNNPEYVQFFKLSQIPNPSRIFVFIEEHPDSINDGYFLNKMDTMEWTDLPASYHHGGANLSYADGHAEGYRWRFSSTKPPARPDAALLPKAVPQAEQGDFKWLMRRTSLDEEAHSY